MTESTKKRPIRVYSDGDTNYVFSNNKKTKVKGDKTDLQKKYLNKKISIKLLPYKIVPEDRPRFKLIRLTDAKDILPVEETDEYLKMLKRNKPLIDKLKIIEVKIKKGEDLTELEKKELPLLLEEKKILDAGEKKIEEKVEEKETEKDKLNLSLSASLKELGIEPTELKIPSENLNRWLDDDRIKILHNFLKNLQTLDAQRIINLVNRTPNEFIKVSDGDKVNDLLAKIMENITPSDYNRFITYVKYTRYFGSDSEKIKNPSRVKTGKGVKLDALYNDEIDDFFEDYPNYGGTISADQIQDLPKKLPIGFIMNLDNSNEPGSHWVAVYIDQNSVEYFDPLADPPTQEFKKDIKKYIESMNLPNLLKFKINKVKQQNSRTETCGFHSIRFLDDRFSGIPYNWSTRYKDNSEKGEKNVDKEFSFI